MTNTRKDDVCVCDLCLVGTQVRSVAHGKKLKNSGHFLGRALGGWGGIRVMMVKTRGQCVSEIALLLIARNLSVVLSARYVPQPGS